MSLDPTPDVATLLRMKAEREARYVRRADDPPLPPTATTLTVTSTRTVTSGKPGRPKGQHTETEHDIQVAFFAKVNDPAEQAKRPALALVYAVPNGGARTLRTAGRLKAEGVRPGVPDVLCPVPRGGYVGLAIEFKRPGGTTSPAQASWLAALAAEGWKAELHTIATEAFRALCDYLDQPRTSLTPPTRPAA